MRLLPTPRLAVAAAGASALALVLPGSALLVPLLVVDGALLLLAAVDAWAAPDPGRVDVERELAPVAVLGVPLPIAWRVGNPSPRRLRVALADELAPSLHASTRRLRATLPPGASVVTTASLTPSRRGRFVPTRVVVRVEGPLGLGARQAVQERPQVLRVHPAFPSRAEAEARTVRSRVLEVGSTSVPARGGGTDFDQLREYGTDDDPRHIDWAATARTGRAIVRTYRAEQDQSVLVLLDTGRVMAGRVAGVPRLDHAMDAVMCLTSVAAGVGDRCGLVAFADEVRATVPAGGGPRQVGRIVDAMYELQPELVESDYRRAFTAALAHHRRRSLVVLFTDLVPEALGEALLPALPMLVRDHLVVVAAVSDPDVTGWSTSAPLDAEAAYRAAAAASALAERERASAQLRRLGAVVVDATVGELAPRLADAYLGLKARGAL